MVLVVGLLLGCTSSPPVGADPLSTWPSLGLTGIDSVVLFQADTLRADRLPWYDGPNNTMPRSQAYPWWVHEQYIAVSSWTVPTVSSVLTGLLPAEHRMVFNAERDDQHLPSPTLQEHLAENGVSAAFFTGNTLLDTVIDADRGWETYRLNEAEPGNARALVADGLNWLDTQDGPFFLMLQPMDGHHPWAPLPEFYGTLHDPADLPFDLSMPSAARIAAMEAAWQDPARAEPALRAVLELYDEEILGIDLALATLLEGLASRGLAERTLVVFTADHGETFLDDGTELGHAGTLRPELVKIPFLLHHPALTDDRITHCPTSQADLAATLLHELGLPPMDTPSRPFQCGATETSTLFYTRSPEKLLFNAVTRADTQVVLDCDPGVARLYDLDADPYTQDARLPGEDPRLDAWLLPALHALDGVLHAWPNLGCPIDTSR